MNRKRLRIGPGAPLRGPARIPGDKSISHRAVLLGSLADGRSRIVGFLDGRDCRATVDVMRALGARIDLAVPGEMHIRGAGLRGLQEPRAVLDCRNSGTTMRLLAGLLAGQAFTSVATGTRQLCGRPMARIIEPLQRMGAHVHGRGGDRFAPLTFVPATDGLRGCVYALPVASAQVKSCLLLASLFSTGETVVTEPGPTRNHTERMLRAMGGLIEETDGRRIVSRAPARLQPLAMRVPGDASSAAFLVVAATLTPDSRVRLENVGCNETRTGLLDALQVMGASIARLQPTTEGGEDAADLVIQHSPLRAGEFGGDLVVRMIDEVPLLVLACTQAEGTSVIRDAQELRVKESDRIADTVAQLRRLGADVEGTPDGFVVRGPTPLQGGTVDSRGDHRLAMMLSVAGLLTDADTVVQDAQVTDDSFPGFAQTLAQLGADAVEEEERE